MNRITKGLIMGTLGVFISGGALTFAVNKNNQINYSNINAQNLITPEKAKKIMLSKVPNGTFIEFSFDDSDNSNEIPTFDGKLIKDDMEYDIEINAKDGSIFKLEKEALINSSQETITTKLQQKFIGEEKAKNIMFSKVPNSKITKFYLDNDNTPEYEGTLINKNNKYDITINAITGDILEFEREIIETSQTTTSKPSSSNNAQIHSNNYYYDDDHDDISEDNYDDND